VVPWVARAGVDMYGCSGSRVTCWRGYFADFLVILEGTRRRVHHGGRAERRATVRGARRRGTRKGRPMLRESVRICAECAGRQVEQQRNGHYWQRDGQMPPNSTEPHGTPGSARLALSS